MISQLHGVGVPTCPGRSLAKRAAPEKNKPLEPWRAKRGCSGVKVSHDSSRSIRRRVRTLLRACTGFVDLSATSRVRSQLDALQERYDALCGRVAQRFRERRAARLLATEAVPLRHPTPATTNSPAGSARGPRVLASRFADTLTTCLADGRGVA